MLAINVLLGSKCLHDCARVVRNDVQQYQRGAMRRTVATLPVAKGGG